MSWQNFIFHLKLWDYLLQISAYILIIVKSLINVFQLIFIRTGPWLNQDGREREKGKLFMKIVKFSWQIIFHGCKSKRRESDLILFMKGSIPFIRAQQSCLNESERSSKVFHLLLVLLTERKGRISLCSILKEKHDKTSTFLDSSFLPSALICLSFC